MLLPTAAMACITAEQDLAITVNAQRSGAPVRGLIFGGFMEPATTAVRQRILSAEILLSFSATYFRIHALHCHPEVLQPPVRIVAE